MIYLLISYISESFGVCLSNNRLHLDLYEQLRMRNVLTCLRTHRTQKRLSKNKTHPSNFKGTDSCHFLGNSLHGKSACTDDIVCFLFFGLTAAARGFPDQGSNPRPLRWKCEVLTTGPPGKSLLYVFCWVVGFGDSDIMKTISQEWGIGPKWALGHWAINFSGL